MNPVLLAVLGYVGLQLLVGMWVSRNIRTESDYLLAGRGLGPGLAMMSLFATWFGAETCLGAAGAVYKDGLGGGKADPFGYTGCLLLMGAVFAVALRKTGAVTLGDVFRDRFSPWVERLVVLMTVPASILWGAAQIRAMGQVLSSLSSYQLEITIPFAALVVIVYTVSGGIKADVMTDFIQGIGLIIGLALLGWAVVTHLGGPAAAWSHVHPEQLSFQVPGESGLAGRLEPWLVPVLGSVTAQEMASRVLASRTPGIGRSSSLMAGGLYLCVGLVPVLLGLLGAGLLPGLSDPEQVLPRLAHAHLHPLGVVLFTGALFSAILSTVDSNLLSASALTSHNVILRIWNVPDERQRVRVTRLATLAAGLVAWGLAFSRESVFRLVEESSAFGGAGMFVAMTFGLLTRFGGRWAGLAAMVTGIVTQLAGTYLLGWRTPFTTSLVVSGLAYVAVGLAEGAVASRRPRPRAA
jgi:solute:Na+ symporter, SSS family